MYRARRLVPALAFTVVLLSGLSCSDAGVDAGPGTTQGSTAPLSSSTTAAPVVAGDNTATGCGADKLIPAIQTKYAAATLTEVICDSPFAVATVRGRPETPANGVAMFRIVGTSWTLVADGTADAPEPGIPPADFSSATFGRWKAAYEKSKRPPTESTSKPAATIANNTQSTSCTGEGQNEACETITVPPSTAPATTPDGNTIPTTPPVTSQFCRFNFADPRCKANPEFPG